MILGPNDPRAITGKELEDARRHTLWFNTAFGIPPLTAEQKKAKDELLDSILDIIAWEDPS